MWYFMVSLPFPYLWSEGWTVKINLRVIFVPCGGTTTAACTHTQTQERSIVLEYLLSYLLFNTFVAWGIIYSHLPHTHSLSLTMWDTLGHNFVYLHIHFILSNSCVYLRLDTIAIFYIRYWVWGICNSYRETCMTYIYLLQRIKVPLSWIQILLQVLKL